ncbi:MAG TPA: HDOD domain-containing protein [Nannocystaceae bacterium]|nr:HDOD domain-containing protein [Nannocystaceae bacterium]
MSVALTISPRDIPLLPGGMLEILRLANDPNVSLAQIERSIGRDQALAVRVLTVANSSYYGCSRRIDSVRGAVALLGTRQIQNIAAALAIAPAFDSEHGPRLWSHAVAAALWSQRIVKELGLPSIEYLFTTALMHDIGIVMLLTRATDLELGCIELARTDARSLQEIELAQLGCNHADLGAQVCRAWNLPDRVANLIADHHGGESIDAPAAILALADHLAVVHGSPAFEGMPAREPTKAELAAIGMQPSALANLGRHAEAVAAEAAGLS